MLPKTILHTLFPHFSKKILLLFGSYMETIRMFWKSFSAQNCSSFEGKLEFIREKTAVRCRDSFPKLQFIHTKQWQLLEKEWTDRCGNVMKKPRYATWYINQTPQHGWKVSIFLQLSCIKSKFLFIFVYYYILLN